MKQTLKKPPKTILKEAIYSKLFNLPTSEKAFNLESEYSDNYNLEELFSRYLINFGYPPGFHRLEDSKVLRQEMAIALRNRCDAEEICAKVSMQALEKGLPYVLFGVSAESKLLKSLAKDVIVEVNRAKSLYFQPLPENPMVVMAQYRLQHDTADLILKYFSKRFPTRIVCLKSGNLIFWLKDNSFYCKSQNEFRLEDIETTAKEEQSGWKLAR